MLTAFLGAVLMTCLGGCVQDELPVGAGDVKAGLKLLKEGDELADKGQTTDAEIRYQQAMEQLLPKIRGVPFKEHVKRDVTPRDKIRDYMVKDFEEDQSPEEMRGEELAFKAFGLFPRKFDYKETMLKVLTEEVGAFYDPRTDTMHLILESGGGRKPGLLEMLMGRKPGFSKDETKITIAHELTHALDDQHHDLDKMLKAIKKNDDAEIALSALIEGDATLAMMAAGQEDWQGEVTALLPEDALGQTFRLMMPFLSMGSGASLRSAPPIISQSLLFPYLQGLVFCAHLTNTGGWKAIDTAYGQPPRSTEQVIHPEKYDTARDEPTTINLGTLAAPAGWKEIRRNVLGEMQIAVLLRSQKGNEAAAGWDGDQYVAFEGPDDKLGLVWFSTWDSEDDAKQFANALARYQHSRFGGDKPAKDADVYTREREHTVFMVERRGLDVLAIEGFDEQTTQAIAKSGWEAKKTNLDSTRSSSDRR